MSKIIFYSVYVFELLLNLLLISLSLDWSKKNFEKYTSINKKEWEEIKTKNIDLKSKVKELNLLKEGGIHK